VLIQAIAGRANINGRPFDGSAAEAATKICKWLGEPEQVIWCLHDEAPIKPYYVDVTAATSMITKSTGSQVRVLEPAKAVGLFSDNVDISAA
jgi:hypothetical protein